MSARGLTIPFVMIFVAVFISVPLLFWYVSNSGRPSDIRGASDSNVEADVSGLKFGVNSFGGTWDLFAYLCEDYETCVESLTAGKKHKVVSGGTGEDFGIAVPKVEEWDSYEYLKVFVKPSWGSHHRTFKVLENVKSTDVSVETIEVEGEEITLVLVYLENAESLPAGVATFSDR